jgi:hypothetical protein
MTGRYKVITLCGSTRFKDEFLQAQKRLTLEGNIVISVGLFGHSGDDEVWTEGTKEMLDDMHKRKIDMADAIFVINAGGYIGSSTRSEIEYAVARGKEVMYLVQPGKSVERSVAEQRVASQSARLRAVQRAYNQVLDSLEALESRKDDIKALETYLSTDWRDDYEADERGEIGNGVDRAVLGQDTLFNLLEEIGQLNDDIEE